MTYSDRAVSYQYSQFFFAQGLVCQRLDFTHFLTQHFSSVWSQIQIAVPHPLSAQWPPIVAKNEQGLVVSVGRGSPFCLKVAQDMAIGSNLGHYLAQASSFDLHGTVQVGACGLWVTVFKFKKKRGGGIWRHKIDS